MASKTFYKDAVAAFIFFDLSHPNTLLAALKWKANIEAGALLPDGSALPCILVANKCDLIKESNPQLEAELEKALEKHSFIKMVKTSVKDNINVNETVVTLLDHVCKLPCIQPNAVQAQLEPASTVVLSQQPINVSVQQSKCCSNASSNVFVS